jgi:selenocysteine-specific elongation factor
VLRDTSGRRTLGGATVIDPYAPRRVRDRPRRLQLLHALRESDLDAALLEALKISADGVDPQVFAHARNVDRSRIVSSAQGSGAIEIDTAQGSRMLMPKVWQSIQAAMLDDLTSFHEQNPEAVGLAEADLIRRALAAPERPLGEAAIAAMLRASQIAREGINLRLPTHRAQLSARDEALWAKVSGHLDEQTTKPLTSGDLALTLEIELPALLAFLEGCARRGQLIRVSRNRFFHPRAVARLAEAAQTLGESAGAQGFDARAYRDATGVGRNLTIEVLEFFDTMGLTRRIGQTRQVIRDSAQIFGAADPAATSGGATQAG